MSRGALSITNTHTNTQTQTDPRNTTQDSDTNDTRLSFGGSNQSNELTTERNETWKCLQLGLCYFNAVVNARKEFGALGWNAIYDFRSEF